MKTHPFSDQIASFENYMDFYLKNKTHLVFSELTCLLLSNEIVFKIFGYLNIQEIRLGAQVSHQFNIISTDSSLKPERLIGQKRNPEVQMNAELKTMSEIGCR